MQLGDRVSAHFTYGAVMVGDTLGTFLQSTANDGGLVIDLANDQDGADDSRCQTLKNNGLIVIDGDL